MTCEIKNLEMGGVNCFLVKTGEGFLLIDTGVANKRDDLEKELVQAGCKAGDLKLILLTHGDSDHADNSLFLREKFGAKIAMHTGDAGMVERGDMDWNRKPVPDRTTFFGKIISTIFGAKPVKFDKFSPDLLVEDGYDLNAWGLDARVLHLPGHSKGSIGILTADGDLYCGDLFMNFVRPGLHFMIDDLADANASLEKLKNLDIRMVYPGHGRPFLMERL